MITHAQIKQNVASAIAADTGIRDYCISKFGRGALVIVDWFGAEGAPGENEAPYIFLYSTGENASGMVEEETFEFVIELGGVTAPNAPYRKSDIERTATANGLITNGCASVLEALRAKVVQVLKAGAFGASLRSVTFEESSTVSYPLEWASVRCEFFEPETITP